MPAPRFAKAGGGIYDGGFAKGPMFKIEFEDGKGIWHDVYGEDGKLLTFEREDAARAALAERYPILVQMEKYAGGKRTRVIRILEDEDDWPKKGK